MNSINFIKQRISENKMAEWMPKEGWDDSTIEDPMKILYQMINKEYNNSNSLELTHIINDKKKKVIIEYNPDFDYGYCITEQSKHDGTLLFSIQVIHEDLQKLLYASTYDKANVPKDFKNTEEGIMEYDIKYTIGDLIWHKQFSKGKQTDIIIIPAKCEFIRNDN